MGRVVVVASLVLLILWSTEAQDGCLRYETQLSDGSVAFCAGLIDYPYYAENISAPQEILEGVALQELTQDSPFFEQLLSLLPETCAAQLKRNVCQIVFPKCELVHPYFLDQAPLSGPSYDALPSDKASCEFLGLHFFEEQCGVPLPRFPCRQECSSITSIGGEICPMVSGLFYPFINAFLAAPQTDTAVQTELTNLLSSKSCSSSCAPTTRFTMNFMQLLNVTRSCENQVIPGDPLGLELFPDGNQTALKGLVDGEIAVIAGNGGCGPNGFETAVTCDSIRSVYQCWSAPSQPRVQGSYEVIESGHPCESVVKDATNQDFLVAGNLASIDRDFQLLNGAGGTQASLCLASALQRYRGAYFVPPFPGMVPFGFRRDASNVETELDNDNSACPFEVEPLPRFANNEQNSPLCFSANSLEVQGFNSRDCLLIALGDALGQIPTFSNIRCTVAFRDFACSQALMKLQARSICLVPEELGGCIVDDPEDALNQDRVAVTYALPRFPARAMCELFADECSNLLQVAGIAVNCSESISITQCGNPTLGFWSCSSSFNGRPAYPVAEQVFADVSQFPSDFASYIGLLELSNLTVSLDDVLSSDVVNPTISAPLYNAELTAEEEASLLGEFCLCPEPLVVPEDPSAETVTPEVCCALPCRGTMLTIDDMKQFGLGGFICNLIGVVLSLYMVLTWGIFKEKKTQYMTFWISFCSLILSISFLMEFAASVDDDFDISTVLCKDNSNPIRTLDGVSVAAVQSVLLSYFALALCFWWLCQSIDLARKIVLRVSSQVDSRRYYHMFAWFTPFPVLLGLLASDNLGFRAPIPWSLIAVNENVPNMDWFTFYGLVGAATFFGSISMLAVIYTIFSHTRKSRRILNTTAGSASAQRFKTFNLYRKPMLFVLVFTFVWANIFALRALTSANEDLYTDQGAAWVQCLLENAANGIEDPRDDPSVDNSMLIDASPDLEGCGRTQPGGVPNASLQLTFYLVQLQSFLVFITFGTDTANLKLWREFLAKGRIRGISESKGSKTPGSPTIGTPKMGSVVTVTPPSAFYSRFDSEVPQTYSDNSAMYDGGPPPSGRPPSPPPGY